MPAGAHATSLSGECQKKCKRLKVSAVGLVIMDVYGHDGSGYVAGYVP